MPKRSRPLPGASTGKRTVKKADAPVAGPALVSAPGVEGGPAPAPSADTFDDRNIIRDIKKTGIIAGAILVILVALSVVLR